MNIVDVELNEVQLKHLQKALTCFEIMAKPSGETKILHDELQGKLFEASDELEQSE